MEPSQKIGTLLSTTMKRAAMATFSPKHSSHSSKFRSISLPTRSHPSTIRIEEELNKVRSWEASSSSSSKVETICCGISGLSGLYKCVEDLLKLPLTQKALSHHHDEKWVDGLLECPVRFLHILGETRDAIMLMKGNLAEIQSALRRRKVGDLGMENHINAYWRLRRNMRKECTKSLLLLKQVDQSLGATPPLDLNHHLSAVVQVLRETSLVTSSIFQSLMVFLSSSIFECKLSNWAFVSRLMQKGVLVCNNRQDPINEVQKVDLSLRKMSVDNLSKESQAEKIQSAHRDLQALLVVIEGLKNGLECLFKHLIYTRVSFLNMVSP